MVSTKKGTIQPQWRSQGLLLCYDWINLVLLLSVYLEGEWLSHPWICKGLSSFILNLWKIIKWFNSSLSVHLTWNMYWHMGSLCPFSKRENKKINMAQRDVAAETGKSSAQQPRAEVSRDHELYSIYTLIISAKRKYSPYWQPSANDPSIYFLLLITVQGHGVSITGWFLHCRSKQSKTNHVMMNSVLASQPLWTENDGAARQCHTCYLFIN